MRKHIYTALLILVSFSWAIGQTTKENETDKYLIKIFNYAKKHDLKALEAMNTKLVSEKNNLTISIAYPLALYIASPDKYKNRFIDSFPENYEGIMYVLYDQIELKQLTPNFLYSIKALGIIAKEGNMIAIKKVLNGYNHSDGIVAEVLCDIITELSQTHSKELNQAISFLNDGHKQNINLCLQSK